MASTTTNLGLTKPAYTDDADVAVINANSDIIDAAYGSLSDQIATKVKTVSPNKGATVGVDESTNALYFNAERSNSNLRQLQLSDTEFTLQNRINGAWSRAWTISADVANALIKNDAAGTNTVSDFNSLTTTSLLSYGGNTPNAPTTNGGVVLTLATAYGSQIAQFCRPNNQQYFAVRFFAGSWSSWVKLAVTNI